MRYIFINTTNITSLATILSVNHKHPNIWLWGVDDYWNESGWQVLHRGFLSYGRGTEYFDGLPCPMGCTACWLGEEDSPNDRRWKKTLPTIRTVKKGDASPRSSPEGEDVFLFKGVPGTDYVLHLADRCVIGNLTDRCQWVFSNRCWSLLVDVALQIEICQGNNMIPQIRN